jgi:hypothetical protein
MKRSRIYWLVIVPLLVAGGTFFMNAAGEVKDGYPSKIFFEKTGSGQNARFVLTEMPDIRLLFCDRPLLKDRINRSVCVVDDVRTTLAKSEQASAREIPIEKSVSAGELLRKIGLEKWKGGQPQLRIVKRDAIIQSPLVSDTSAGEPDVDAFLSQNLQPGDFLIITPRS